EKAKDNELNLKDFQLNKMNWTFDGARVKLSIEEERTSFVEKAMEVSLRYLTEQSVELYPVSISIRSELDDPSGYKYGLGSSAAVVTGVVTALLTKFLASQPQEEIIFKLAAIAHVSVQGSGSGADIAASTYGGILEYKSFQAKWLQEQMKQTKEITKLLHKPWTYLHIKPLQFPKDWKMIVGWTGNPASTAKLVPQVLAYKNTNENQFNNFVEQSAKSVQDILAGIKEHNKELFFRGVRSNREALARIGELSRVPIETPLLYNLQEIAQRNGAVGKLSGAGGGDCGIAFTTAEDISQRIKKEWAEAGIKNLELTHYAQGAKKTQS